MAEKTSITVKNLLATTAVSALHSPKGHVVVVKSNETPYEGFKKLLENNILSAPVYDLVAKKYTGFLDMKDLISFVVFVDDDQKSNVPNNLQAIITSGCKLFKVPTEGVSCTYLSRRNSFHPVSKSDSLLDVCKILAKGLHRVPVVDDNGEVVDIISQSSIISFLHKHASQTKHETVLTIKELHIGTNAVISATADTKAIDVFRLMDNKKISGVAVVDEEGKLIGNTSGSDLKLFIKTLSVDILQEPITQFLKKIRQESVEIRSPTISCSSRDTLSMLIGKLASTKVHKIFVADDSSGYKPLAVVSITDILRYFMKE